MAVISEFSGTPRSAPRRGGRSPRDRFTCGPPRHDGDWVIRHDPAAAQRMVGDIVRDAQDKLGIAPDVVGYALIQAMALDGSLDRDVVRSFLERSLPPGALDN